MCVCMHACVRACMNAKHTFVLSACLSDTLQIRVRSYTTPFWFRVSRNPSLCVRACVCVCTCVRACVCVDVHVCVCAKHACVFSACKGSSRQLVAETAGVLSAAETAFGHPDPCHQEQCRCLTSTPQLCISCLLLSTMLYQKYKPIYGCMLQ